MTEKSESNRPPARNYSAECKRKVVEQTFAGDRSVRAVAQEHSVSGTIIWR